MKFMHMVKFYVELFLGVAVGTIFHAQDECEYRNALNELSANMSSE